MVSSSPAAPAARPIGMTLHRRLFGAYTALLTVALAVLIFAPVTISVPVAAAELAGLLIAFALMLATYHVLLRRTLDPLERLTAVMRRVDPLQPGRRITVQSRDAEVLALAQAFNAMLDRIEGERRDSARRALAAQEAERRRIARELHDEIGQVLTGLVLRAETLARRAPDDLRADLEALREAARHGAEEVRVIARRLRPEALDQLGLQSALLALCAGVAERGGLEVGRRLARDLPGLEPEQELVLYRVAQEALTNVVRHARARHVDVELAPDGDGGVVLRVADDGAGLPADAAGPRATGLRGMRERALLIGADITIAARAGGGTEVRLHLPADETP